jgi:hypothetical protein
MFQTLLTKEEKFGTSTPFDTTEYTNFSGRTMRGIFLVFF